MAFFLSAFLVAGILISELAHNRSHQSTHTVSERRPTPPKNKTRI